MQSSEPTLAHHPAAERFELREGDQLAFAAYTRVENTLFLAYSEIPEAMAERGLGDHLMRGAYAFARANGLSVIPICPLARDFLERAPEYRDLVREEHR